MTVSELQSLDTWAHECKGRTCDFAVVVAGRVWGLVCWCDEVFSDGWLLIHEIPSNKQTLWKLKDNSGIEHHHLPQSCKVPLFPLNDISGVFIKQFIREPSPKTADYPIMIFKSLFQWYNHVWQNRSSIWIRSILSCILRTPPLCMQSAVLAKLLLLQPALFN